MRELIELRVFEKYASRIFLEHEGDLLGGLVRRVVLDMTSPRYDAVSALLRTYAAKGVQAISGWDVRRTYTRTEMQAAGFFHARITAGFEPAAEECGTRYNEGAACPACGSGAEQIGDLLLDVRRIPRSKDVARALGGEIVVSRRFADLVLQQDPTAAGIFGGIVDIKNGRVSPDWFQMRPSGRFDMSPATQTGNDPFDHDPEGRYRCPRGDLVGLALLSEVFIDRITSDAGIWMSNQFVGIRRGLIRPERVCIMSADCARALMEARVQGLRFEVAHAGPTRA